MQRIEYIDNIKGFAMLLVVMGHVIANWFYDFYAVYDNDPDNQLMVWRLIYSFHMPLFMFCSGLFQPILGNNSTMHDVWSIMVRRMKVLMIPYFASGLLLWQVTGRLQLYWYLLILFEFIAINLIISYIANKFSQKSNIIEAALFIITFLATHVLASRFAEYEKLPLLDFGHMGLYIFFTAGYLVVKYKLLDRIFSNLAYSISIIIFMALLVYTSMLNFNVKIPLSGITSSFCGIYAVFYLFKVKLNNPYATKVFSYLGRHSLELYILHFFFLTKLPFVGDFIQQTSAVGGGRIIFVMGIVLSLFLSVINILLSLLAMNIIKTSRLLSMVLLGRKSNS